MENDKQLNSEIKSDLEKLNDIERQNVLNWAVEVRKIQQNNKLSSKEKIYDLKNLNNKQVFKNVISIVLNYSKSYWKKANWAQKIGIIGLTGGLIVAGASGGAGIAALGGAIGLPLFLVTTAGGTFIGTIIDSLNKKNGR
jgi:hypothetical protein